MPHPTVYLSDEELEWADSCEEESRSGRIRKAIQKQMSDDSEEGTA